MKKKLVLFILFLLSFSLSSIELSNSNKFEKIIFISDFTLSPLSEGEIDASPSNGNSTKLIYELKDNFDPNVIWDSFTSEYGDVTGENVEFYLQYYQNAVNQHYFILKTNFSTSTGYQLTNQELYSSSPYITLELQYYVDNINELDPYLIDLAFSDNIYQLAVIPSMAGLPFTQMDPGGGGSSTCDSNKFTNVKTAIQYEQFQIWDPTGGDNGTGAYVNLAGNGIRIGILEGDDERVVYSVVKKEYVLNEGLSDEVNVFGSRVHWHPLYEYILDFGYDTPGSIHSTDVAHIAAGYNGLAFNSNIFSVDYRADFDITSTSGFSPYTYANYAPVLSISDYFEDVYTDWPDSYPIHVINISAGNTIDDYYDITSLNYYNKIYNKYAYVDQMIIIASAGNSPTNLVASPSSAANIFSVGGTNNDGDDYYFMDTTEGTSFIDYNNGIQKPNIIAPAIIDLSLDTICNTDPIRGTSYSAPLVTGAVALLLEKQPELKARASEVFALLTATASNLNFPITTDNSYDEMIGNKSGAGILQVTYLLNNSQNTFTKSFTPSTTMHEEVIYNINPSEYYQTLRVALFWMTKIENNEEFLNDYTLEVYINDILVGTSDSSGNNTELVIHNIHEDGTLKIKIIRNGTFLGNNNDNVGVAWALTND